MKNKYLIIVFLLGISGMFTIQSCTKDETPTPVVYKADVPSTPTPAVGVALTLGGTPYTLKWEGTTAAVDIHFGTTKAASDTVYKLSGGKTFDLKVLPSGGFTKGKTTVGGQYFWYIQTVDANGMVSSTITEPARDAYNFYINSAPTAPVLTTPADGSVGFSVAGALTWTATDAEDDGNLTYNVFFGKTDSTMALVANGLTDATYKPTMVASTKYFWRVVATDPHNASTSSAVHSFTSGLEPIMSFTGNYTADEPAEAYNYPVVFTKKSATAINIDAWWNSWAAVFNLDLVAGTYTMPYTVFTSGYSGSETGAIINAATGKMQGTYTVWKNGVIVETGVHTYTR